MTIRSAKLCDCDAIAALMDQLGYPTSASQMRDRIEPLLVDPLYRAAVALIDDRIAGMIGGRVDRGYEYDGLQARIVALVVDEAQRGTGIGRALVEEIERWGAKMGAHKIIVNTANRRLRTHDFYRSCGFESTGLRFAKTLLA